MVRALKKLQTYLVHARVVDKELPSYLTECLVYNVDDDQFGNTTFKADMRAVLASIFNATLPSGNSREWLEVNELRYLFRLNKPWTTSGGTRGVAHAAWDTMGLGVRAAGVSRVPSHPLRAGQELRCLQILMVNPGHEVNRRVDRSGRSRLIVPNHERSSRRRP